MSVPSAAADARRLPSDGSRPASQAAGPWSTVRRTVRGRPMTPEEEARRREFLAFFDDYDSAMVNSNLPETGAFASKLQELLAGPPTFVDLEVVQDLT